MKTDPDFLFPQMATPHIADPVWEPAYLVYLYVSFTNATAFSPTDTMPLTRWANMIMLAQPGISLVIVALVIARAVNNDSHEQRRQRMTATTELGFAVMTVLSIAAALTCRLDRLATARFMPPIFGLMLAISVLLALIAIGQHDSALATLVILDLMLMWYALTMRGHVLTDRLERLRREHALSNHAHPSRWPNPPSQPPKDNEDDGQR